MDDKQPEPDATAIWDQHYTGGTHVGSKPNIDGDPVDYTQHKFLYSHGIAKPLTGNLDGWIINDVGKAFMRPPVERMLAIGSGMAFIEEHLATEGYAKHILAYEMSRVAIEAARDRIKGTSAEHVMELRSGDVLEDDLPSGHFDVVFVQAAIHHFDKIDAMFQLMHRVLKPGGLLIYDEYVGPDHHMYEPETLAIMDEINDCLAESYRRDHLAQQTRVMVPRPNLEWMLQHDPSEGVHASQILPLTYQYFDVIQRRDYGGSILRPFFTGILPSFDFSDPKDQTVARLIILIEQMMTRNGLIPHYNTNVVARRRAVPRPALTEQQARHINRTGWQSPDQSLAGDTASSTFIVPELPTVAHGDPRQGGIEASPDQTDTDQDIISLRKQVAALKASTSWRITAPLRAAMRLLS